VRTKLFWACAVVLVILQFSFLYLNLSQSGSPFGEDQDAYLKAIDQAQQGKSYFDGQKNPLLPVVLSTVVPRGEASYTASRLWIMVLTVLMTCGQLLWAKKLWGHGAALMWAYLLAFNATALELGSMVMVEPWLLHIVGFFLLAWCQALVSKRSTDWYLVGALLGLGLLAKGTIPVLLTAVALALLLSRRFKVCAQVMVVSLVVYLPFLIYRQMVFGNPFHQVSQGISWLGFYHPHNLQGSSLSEFVADQGVGALFKRLCEGMRVLPQLAFSALGPISSSWKFSALVLAVVFSASFWRWSKNIDSPVSAFINLPKESKWLACVWGGLWFIFCAWMVPVAYVTRYFIPLLPLLASAVVLAWRRPKLNAALPMVVLLLTVFFLPWPEVSQQRLLNPDLSWRQDSRFKSYQKIRHIIEKDAGEKPVKIFYGPGRTLPETWLWNYERVTLLYGQQGDRQEILDTLKKSDYLVLDEDTMKHNGEPFLYFSQKLTQQYKDERVKLKEVVLKLLKKIVDENNENIYVFKVVV